VAGLIEVQIVGQGTAGLLDIGSGLVKGQRQAIDGLYNLLSRGPFRFRHSF
jgi:hypothetical protein